MDPIDRRLLLGAAGLAGVAALSKLTPAARGGPLEPPAGPIGPTGRTTGEVYDRVAAAEALLKDRIARTDAGVAEPRIPVQSLPGSKTAVHVISEPGSYYLAGNISGEPGKHAIEVLSDNVSIDLAGYCLLGAKGSLCAVVSVASSGGLTLQNGTVTGWFGGALKLGGTQGITLANMLIAGCGNAAMESPWSTLLGNGAVAHDVIVRSNTAWGLFANSGSILHRVAAIANAGPGISVQGGSVILCTARNHPDGGIGLSEPGVIHQCTAIGNTYGIVADYGVTVSGNSVSYNQYGIVTTQRRNLIDANIAFFNNTGLDIRDTGSTVRGNTVAENASVGIRVPTGGNLIISNSLNANGTNLDIAPGNSHGPIVNVAGIGDISAVPGANHPWANFIY